MGERLVGGAAADHLAVVMSVDHAEPLKVTLFAPANGVLILEAREPAQAGLRAPRHRGAPSGPVKGELDDRQNRYVATECLRAGRQWQSTLDGIFCLLWTLCSPLGLWGS